MPDLGCSATDDDDELHLKEGYERGLQLIWKRNCDMLANWRVVGER
jgi:hypothetical protein